MPTKMKATRPAKQVLTHPDHVTFYAQATHEIKNDYGSIYVCAGCKDCMVADGFAKGEIKDVSEAALEANTRCQCEHKDHDEQHANYRFHKEHQTIFDIPKAIRDLVKSGELIDVTWHNDVCPSFEHADFPSGSDEVTDLRLWVHHEDPDLREMHNPTRFVVYEDTISVAFETDDVQKAIAKLRAVAASMKESYASSGPFMAPPEGWEYWDMGGGQTAWRKPLKETKGAYLNVTEQDTTRGCLAPRSEKATVSLCVCEEKRDNMKVLCMFEDLTLEQAITLGNKLTTINAHTA